MFAIELIRDQLSATFYRRLYYDKMREIVAEHHSARHRRLYALDCAIFLYAHRTLWLAYILHHDFAPIRGEHFDSALRNDIVLGYAYTHPHLADSIMIIMVYMFALFIWTCETLIWRLEPRANTWRWWHEFVVTNQDAYRDSALSGEQISEIRRRLKARYSTTWPGAMLPSVARAVYCSIAARVRMWRSLANIDQRRFFVERPLNTFPNMSHRLRHWLILHLAVVDYLTVLVQAILAFITLTVVSYMAQTESKIAHPIAYTPLARVWIIAELYLVHYCVQHLVHLAIFFTNCSVLGTIVYTGHVTNINRPINALVCLFRRRRSPGPRDPGSSTRVGRLKAIENRWRKSPMLLYYKYRTLLWRQLTDHNKVCYFVLRACGKLFGPVMFAFVLTNIPVNIYLLRKIWFTRLPPVELFTTCLIFLAQILATVAVICPLALCCEVCHSPKRFIPGLQAITSGAGWLTLKLKFDDLYGRLIRGPKIGLSIGPMDAITYKTALEFVLLYVAYFLMAFNQKIQNDLKALENK